MIKKRSPPYSGTTVDPDHSITQINKLLRDYGVTTYQWTTAWEAGHVELRMGLEDEGGKRIMVRLVAATFTETHKTWDSKQGKHVKVQAPNWAQSMRLFHAYVKAKLEAVVYGMRDVREEFLSDTLVRDAAGRETTIGEEVLPALAEGRLNLKALEPPRSKGEAVDAEFSRAGTDA